MNAIFNKFSILAVALMASVATMAQTNPKPGYVITNNGDTVRGNIDFRTNEKLSKQCVFWANGGSESATYKPGDIEGFRFDNGGKYFVTRRLYVTGEPELYFAEFMVQSMMNLYCVVYNRDEYYFFEREDGEMAQLTNRAFLTTSSLQDEEEKLEEKKEQYGKGNIQPLVRGGGFYVLHLGNKESRYYQSKKIVDEDWENTAFFGIYLGAGAQMLIGKHYFRLHADWYKSMEKSSTGNMVKWGFTAEFAL